MLGLDPQVIDLIDSLQKAKAMKLNVYAMITVNQKTWICILKKDLQNDNLNVRSFKMYGMVRFSWCLHAQTLFRQSLIWR
jgi:hypothetical protein